MADADLARDPAMTMRRMLCGLTAPKDGQIDLGGLAAPSGAGVVDRLPEPDALPDVAARRTSSTTTSASFPAPGSPAA